MFGGTGRRHRSMHSRPEPAAGLPQGRAKPLSARVEFRLGFRCNARCSFCYYLDHVDDPVEKDPPTGEVLKRLAMIRKLGASEIEFTGGEPTICKDLPQLITAAKGLGFANVSLITNGIKLANRAYAEALCSAGANDFLFSIHGATAELHDEMTKVRGSFDKIVAAVENVRAFGARCRSSTTITAQNYRSVAAIFEKLLSLRMECMHLALFSPVADAKNAETAVHVGYAEATRYIKEAIDLYRGRLPPLSVKYVPFCFMQGYENYVMNVTQQSFDPDDWNYYFSHKIRRGHTFRGSVVLDAAALLGALLIRPSTMRGVGWLGAKALGLTKILQLARTRRVAACRQCRYDLVCDHAWKDYLARFGVDEFRPVPGPKVLDPAWCYDFAGYRRPGYPLAAQPISSAGTPKA